MTEQRTELPFTQRHARIAWALEEPTASDEDIDRFIEQNPGKLLGWDDEIAAVIRQVERTEQSFDECSCPKHGKWYAAEDIDRLVRELDVLLYGEEGAAPQAMLCDIVSQVAREKRTKQAQDDQWTQAGVVLDQFIEIQRLRSAVARLNSFIDSKGLMKEYESKGGGDVL